MKEPEWVDYAVVLAIHDEQLAEHGGLGGIRDKDLLASALAKPKNVFVYSPEATLRHVPAAYAAGLAKNHAFLDGNKRTAWVVCALFLELNEVAVVASQTEVVRAMLGLADGTLSEQQLVWWLEQDDVTR